MQDCLFCKIILKEIPAEVVFENEFALAFKDIHPKSPIHVLLVPKVHVDSLSVASQDVLTLGRLLSLADKVALSLGLSSGYKVVINNGPEGGQVVPHLHLHILGGKKLEE